MGQHLISTATLQAGLERVACQALGITRGHIRRRVADAAVLSGLASGPAPRMARNEDNDKSHSSGPACIITGIKRSRQSTGSGDQVLPSPLCRRTTPLARMPPFASAGLLS